MVLIGLGYALWDDYEIDGDAVAFMDISGALIRGDFAKVVNGYWNPGYPALLALGQLLFHPSRWTELQVFYFVNLAIFAGAIAACAYFALGLVPLRDRALKAANARPALPGPALVLAALSVLFFAFQRELSLGKVRSDGLLLLLFLLTAGFLLQLMATGRLRYYPLIGLTLGLAYLTKSYAFLPATILLAATVVYGLTLRGSARLKIVGGGIVAAVLFLALASPYIAAISHQRDRLTTGDSARINYAFFIDRTERWHEWHNGALGAAGGTFNHPEEVLLDKPAIYSYGGHLIGTYPLWFDPSYWTDGLEPHFSFKGHVERLIRSTELLVRYLIAHAEPLVFLFVLLGIGCRWVAWRQPEARPILAIAAIGLVMLAIYAPIDIQDRYISAMYLLILVPLLALLRRPEGQSDMAAVAAALMLAAIAAADGGGTAAQLRRVEKVTGHQGGQFGGDVFPMAHALAEFGVGPGSRLACMGDDACYVNEYWTRLLQSQVAAEIEIPKDGDPARFWTGLANKDEVLKTLRDQGIKALVAEFPAGIDSNEGWRRLGSSRFYAYVL